MPCSMCERMRQRLVPASVAEQLRKFEASLPRRRVKLAPQRSAAPQKSEPQKDG